MLKAFLRLGYYAVANNTGGHMKSEAKGLKRIMLAGVNSWQGLASSWRSEAAIRQEIILLLVLLPVALWVDVSAAERALLLLSALLILIVELLNTGIEVVVDRIGSEYHELSGKAKDIGSAAVLITLVASAAVWLCILL
ncbi:diacylglycerol kinase (ATP) [Rheinheimera pacifica]|nr:diacylglycerol kinase (ATP) [Rheinheimera pacifica]